MKLLRFFIVHSWRDMWRNRSRTAFALVCVATGVAAVVALRSLAFMIADELTTNLAQVNRGDIRIYASNDVPELVQLSAQGFPVFKAEAVAEIQTWAAENGVEVTGARLSSGGGLVKPIVDGQSQKPLTVSWLLVEPEHYPFYDPIMLAEPGGVGFAELFERASPSAGPAEAVWVARLGTVSLSLIQPWPGVPGAALSAYPAYLVTHPRPLVIGLGLTYANSLNLELGDVVQLGAADAFYVVRGVAPSDAESILTNPQTAFTDYLYVPISDLPLFDEPVLPDQIFLKVPLGRDIGAVEDRLLKDLDRRLNIATDLDEELNRATVPELKEQNAESADVIDDMILVMGLSSLLIGGIGIINTMLVVVSRRTLEIAVLKTLGLKAYRVTALFITEALLMGLVGSVLGIVIGVVLSYLIKSVGEEALSLALEWRLYPAAMLSGLFLGLVVTVLFGFLPTLVAGQVRPAVVLRPNEAQMPPAGLLQTMLTLIFMIVVLGLLVNSIIDHSLRWSPVIMLGGAGALVGLFAGVIIGNTRLGQPIPAYYVFRLSRRFERLEIGLTGLAGGLVGWMPLRRWRTITRTQRGQAAITLALRGLRQGILLYGSLAIGAAVSSGIILIMSEMWLPFGFGADKPANDILGAWEQEQWAWVMVWGVLSLTAGLLIRWLARALVGVVAMASLGVSLGGLAGWLGGWALEKVLAGTATWNWLSGMATGLILVEGALALLGVVYVFYWLLVWGISRLSAGLLIGLVSLTLTALAGGGVLVAASLGGWALILLAVGAAGTWAGLQLRVWERRRPADDSVVPGGRPGRAFAVRRPTPRLVAQMGVLGGGVALVGFVGPETHWIGVLASLLVLIGLWRVLGRRSKVDGRLVLREIRGRRSRVASTLLGLSVGIAGLSVISLTTGAVSRLLAIQIDQNAEGNLLVMDFTAAQSGAIRDILSTTEGVEQYAQFTTYSAILRTINGKLVESPHNREGGEARDQAENSNYDRVDAGIAMVLASRENLDDLPDYEMLSGRALVPEDVGRHHIMMRESFLVEELGIKTGDRLIYQFPNGPGDADDVYLRLTVIGIIARQSEQSGFGDQLVVPPGTLPDTIRPFNVVTVAMIDESDPVYMKNALIAMSNVPGVIALELSAITELLENLLSQLKAIPTLVAWLALVAGTAIIANTVALATQERRRQIGVMKAMGLKGWRVLGMLMVENGLIGLIAGLIGVGVGLLVTVILVLASQNPDELQRTIDFRSMGWLVAMSIAVAVGATTLSARSAAAEKPMNVLRYE